MLGHPTPNAFAQVTRTVGFCLTALHARDELFSKQRRQTSEGDAPMPDAPEAELIDLLPAPASAPPMSSMERSIALRLLYGAGPRRRFPPKLPPASHFSVSLSLLSHVSVVSCVLARTCGFMSSQPVSGCQTLTQTTFPWPQKMWVQGGFCAVPCNVREM